MDSMRAISPDCTSIHALLTKFPPHISTSPEHPIFVRLPILESGWGR